MLEKINDSLGSESKDGEVYNNSVLSDDINVSTNIRLYIDDINIGDLNNNPFEESMFKNYMQYAPVLKEDIIPKRDEYHSLEGFEDYKEAIRLYDLSKTITDISLRIKIELTMLWYVYKGTNTDIIFVERSYDKDGKETSKINYDSIIKFLELKYNPVVWKGVYYLYIDGQYHKDSFIKIRKDVDRILQNEHLSATCRIKSNIEEIVYRTNGRWQKHTNTSPFNNVKDIIPVNNCIISFKEEEIVILPVSPVWGYLYSLPVNYDKDADESMIRKFIQEVCMDGDERNEEKESLLIQIIVQAIMQVTALPAYLLSGDGSNGKSTYINLVKRFSGSNNCTSVSLQSLNTDKFKVACLYGKLFNLYADLPKIMIDENSIFKMVTGGDEITGEYKYGQPFSFVNKSVLLYSANELPQVNESTFAFWRRWNLIEFNNKFEINEVFEKELITDKNLSALLNIILRYIPIIKRNGLHKNDKIKEVMEKWMLKSNSAYSFIKSELKVSPNGAIERNNLISAYHEYCADNDITELSKGRLYEELSKKFNIVEQNTTKDKQAIRLFKGISFKTSEDKEKNISIHNIKQSNL